METRRLQYAAILVFTLGGGCTAVPPCSEPQQAAAPSAVQSVPALQQRIKAQDKRIEELTTQLEMLKQLDHSRMKDR